MELNIHEQPYSFFQFQNQQTLLNSFSEIRIGINLFSRLLGMMSFLWLPGELLVKLSVFTLSFYYKNKVSNPKVLSSVLIASNLVNNLAVSWIFLAFFNIFSLPYLVVGIVAMFLAGFYVSSLRLKDIMRSVDGVLVSIDKKAEGFIAKEKELEVQEAEVEALLTIRRFYSMLGNRSVHFVNAMMSIVFVESKLGIALKEKTPESIKALKDESEQAAQFLAKAQA